MDELEKIYYDLSNPAGYGSAQKLKAATGKNVKSWLSGQRVYTLHKPARRRMTLYRRYKVPFYRYQFQADLNDMQKYKDGGYKHILTVVDMFSRYAWAVPLKNKTGKEITNAFREHIPLPIYLQVDQGTEFYNKDLKDFLKKHNVHMFSVYSPQKAAMVERFNRTLKTKMWKYFTRMNTTKWVKILPDLLESYNNSEHRMIKMTPNEARKAENMILIYQQNTVAKKGKLKVDDYVRVSRKKALFAKGYTPNWSEEIFQIDSIDNRDRPVMYTLKDWKNDKITGKFYEQELQKVEKPETFPIEKIHKKQGNKYLVTFLGYPHHKFWTDNINKIENF